MKFTLVFLLLMLPLAAQAQEDPAAVYSKVHKAMLAGNVDEMVKYASASSKKDLDAIPKAQKAATLQFMAKMMPASYTVAETSISPDGKSAELRATGMAAGLLGGKPETNYGMVAFAKEGNEWKVAKTEWSNQRPANFQLAQAKPAAAKPEAAKPEAAKPEAMKPEAAKLEKQEEDVQISEEAAAKQRAEEESIMRKKAAEDAAAERERQREARLALCVIKPVMSDEEIELCKVAYRY